MQVAIDNKDIAGYCNIEDAFYEKLCRLHENPFYLKNVQQYLTDTHAMCQNDCKVFPVLYIFQLLVDFYRKVIRSLSCRDLEATHHYFDAMKDSVLKNCCCHRS